MTTTTIDTIRLRILELRDRIQQGGTGAATLREFNKLHFEAKTADSHCGGSLVGEGLLSVEGDPACNPSAFAEQFLRHPLTATTTDVQIKEILVQGLCDILRERGTLVSPIHYQLMLEARRDAMQLHLGPSDTLAYLVAHLLGATARTDGVEIFKQLADLSDVAEGKGVALDFGYASRVVEDIAHLL